MYSARVEIAKDGDKLLIIEFSNGDKITYSYREKSSISFEDLATQLNAAYYIGKREIADITVEAVDKTLAALHGE